MPDIRADLTRPAHVVPADDAWVPSPLPGVTRLRLDRVGDEVARATSLVRYAPGSAFSPHTHGGGEEFVVLEGVFSDEHGDWPAGTWVRNGVGSHHTPRSESGCVLFVKLWWMHPEETDTVRAGPRDAGCVWSGAHDRADLVPIGAGETIDLAFDGGCEVLVIDGVVFVDEASWGPWTWNRRPGRGRLTVSAETPARLYVRRGHLAQPPPLPEHAR